MKELEPKFHVAAEKDLGIANPLVNRLVSTNMTTDEIELCLHEVDRWVRPETTDLPLLVGPGKSYIKQEPLGVALVIGAWNYPLTTSVPYVASAISAGNCCVVKPSELAPHSSNVIAELFEKYLDKECYRCIEGQVEVAKAIVAEPFDVIVFTGSTEKGKLVAKAAAEHLTPCILELGGKSPTIVDKDADLDNAAYRIIQGRYMNAGQTCIACDYLFVHKEIKEKLIAAFKQKLTNFFGSDPYKSKDYSRVVNELHTNRLKGYLDENHGGKVLVGGDVKAKERYIAPTLVENPRLDSKMMQDEIFGPILPIFEFDDFDYVINFIKDRPKPLALYYYGSGSSKNYKRLKEETSSGALALNESVFHFAVLQAPFGGVGFSGTGKLHGVSGFKALSHGKSILEKGGMNFFPFNVRYPPYNGPRAKVLSIMLDYSGVTQGFVTKIVVAWLFMLLIYLLFRRGNYLAIGNFISKAINTNLGKDL